MHTEAASYHALARALRGDYRALAKARSAHGGWSAAWRARTTHSEPDDRDAAYAALERQNIALVLKEDAHYPALLREIPHPPHALYVRGALGGLGDLPLAIVGTRKATDDSVALARSFARELAARGAAIVSGLAFGIDAAAHEGALEGGGDTFAVLGNGLDHTYPRSHASLAEKILARGGALVSEYPPGEPPLPYRFLERNRIISGLTRGVLVVEAPRRSGSLATARFALEQNREVFAVPGPVRHRNFAGSHELLKRGAALVTSSEDILEALAPERASPHTPELFALDSEEEKAVVAALAASPGPLPVDALIEHSALDARRANQALSFLLMKNVVQETDEGYSLRA